MTFKLALGGLIETYLNEREYRVISSRKYSDVDKSYL